VLTCVNSELGSVFHGQTFMTAQCVLIDPAGKLTVSSAGHPPLLIRNGDTLNSIEAAQTLLGVLPDANYQETSVQLESGGMALSYTDGLYSLKKTDGQRMLPSDLAETFQSARPMDLEDLANAMERKSNGEPFDDDLAAVILRRD
jgi:sigma-B regulation protein RsbU (phosphoserine phosphatase)